MAAMTTWLVTCPDTRWRSRPFTTREDAEREAESIDLQISRVNGSCDHPHEVVEVVDDEDAPETVRSGAPRLPC
jgi:hypothetical protein